MAKITILGSKQNEEGGNQQGDRDVPNLIPPGRTVHHGRLVDLLIQAGDGRKVDDGTPPHAFPQV